MSDNRSSFSNLDQYLQAVQNREKSKFRQRFVLLLVAILGAMGVIAFSNYFSHGVDPLDHKVVKASFNELDIESVSSIFDQNRKAQLVIEYPFGFEDDTVSSLNEYIELVSADQIELTGESLPLASEPNNPLDIPLFFIEGNQVARSQLTFAIAKFDTSLQYRLNLGNGITREIEDQITSYAYKSSGTFSLTLTVTDKAGNERSHARTIQIESPTDNSNSLITSTPNEEQVPNPLNQARISDPSQQPVPDISKLQATTTEGIDLESLTLDPQNRIRENNPSNEVPQPLPRRSTQGSSSANLASNTVLPSNSVEEASGISEDNAQGTLNSQVENIDFSSSDIPLYSASKMPRFKGGKSGMVRYFRSNLKYPQDAIERDVEGNVLVQFVVEPDGRISNPEIIEGIGSGCDEEAMRLVLDMPAWIPGELADEKVPVYSQLLIKFELQ